MVVESVHDGLAAALHRSDFPVTGIAQHKQILQSGHLAVPKPDDNAPYAPQKLLFQSTHDAVLDVVPLVHSV